MIANKRGKVTQSVFLGNIPKSKLPKRGDTITIEHYHENKKLIIDAEILSVGKTFQLRTLGVHWDEKGQ